MASFAILTIFLLYIFHAAATALPFPLNFQKTPDFSQYIKTITLDVPSVDQPTRLIFVGDVHGQFNDLQDLLHKVDYDATAGDILIHTGDIATTKGAHRGSKEVLDWMAEHHITGVRGNNDQAVIDWKAWRDWISSTSAGRAWLHSLDSAWEEDHRKASAEGLDPGSWVRERRRNSPRKHKFWWRQVPADWKMFREHYLIAASLEQHQYKYLLSLPLVLHIPSIHTFTAHAGLLASDISRSATDRKQPLAHYPIPPRSLSPTLDEMTLRLWQEEAILSDIPQNNEPWIVLNMRSILKDKTISKGNKHGAPWSTSYNQMMDRCVGYNTDATSDFMAKGLPCMPTSIIYGHAASRGLDINRWSFGLDTGCVYGRKLTALVLDLPPHQASSTQLEDDVVDEISLRDPTEESQEIFAQPRARKIKFGDNGNLFKASLVDVDCSN